MGTIVVGFVEYANCRGLIFVDKRHTRKSTKIFICTVATVAIWYNSHK